MRHSLTYLSNNLDFCVGVRFFIAYFLDKKNTYQEKLGLSRPFLCFLWFLNAQITIISRNLFFRKKASLEFQVARITIL